MTGPQRVLVQRVLQTKENCEADEANDDQRPLVVALVRQDDELPPTRDNQAPVEAGRKIISRFRPALT